jgi:membrane fusion protein (multidrug efflux system)
MKRKIIVIAVICVLAIGLVLKLMFNKSEIDANAKPKEINVDVPVTLATAAMSVITNGFSVNGTFLPAKELTIVSQTQGKLVSIGFQNGDFVREGQVLAQCDLELLEAQQKLAEANVNKLKNDLKKFEEMYKTNAVTLQQIEEMRLGLLNAQTNLVTVNKQIEYAVIKAPFSGYITKKYIEKGGMLMPGALVAEIIDINTLKFIANVSESDLDNVKKGSSVKITADIYDGILYEGKVRSIGFKADDAKRFPVEIEVRNNASKPIKAGMYGVAAFDGEGTREALLIPRTALVGSIKEPKVFVVNGKTASARALRLGTSTESSIEVIDGLKTGDQVVISGQINLDEGTIVQVIKPSK